MIKKVNKFNKVSDVIDEFRFNKYVYVSKLFNEKYKGRYRIDIYLDFSFLNIVLRNLKDEISFKLQILNNEVTYISSDVILECYEDMIRKVINYEKMEV